MTVHGFARSAAIVLLALVLGGCGVTDPAPTPVNDATSATLTATATSQVATMYAPIFVATAATGYDHNDAGDVVGIGYSDPGCGSFCLAPKANAIWRNGVRTVLPNAGGMSADYNFPAFINNSGLIGGYVGLPGSSTSAVVWVPSGSNYTTQNIAMLPGLTSAEVAGLDESGRLVGWASTGGAIPTRTAPFVWSQADGLTDLSILGFPNERPKGVSPGGKVVTWNTWYQLGSLTSVEVLPFPPVGFHRPGNHVAVINDAGDQAHFLVSTSTQNLVYPFRLSAGGVWRQLSATGTGSLTRYGLGSINDAQDVTLTVLSTGAVAAGPAGGAQSLSPLVSPAYPGATVVHSGPMNAAGTILAQVTIGRSQRLMQLTPVTPCAGNCLIASSLNMTGVFVEDRANPGSCVQGGRMYNVTTATVTVRSETGAPLSNVQVRGRFLDDYWTDYRVAAVTDASGVATWRYQGLCGVGAIAFLVDDLVSSGRTFDRTRGVLTNHVIPSTTPPTPPTNQAPVSAPSVSCVAGRHCTFDGRASTDPDGSIVAWKWTGKRGLTSTQPIFSYQFPKAGSQSITLAVTDNGGATASRTVNFTVLP